MIFICHCTTLQLRIPYMQVINLQYHQLITHLSLKSCEPQAILTLSMFNCPRCKFCHLQYIRTHYLSHNVQKIALYLSEKTYCFSNNKTELICDTQYSQMLEPIPSPILYRRLQSFISQDFQPIINHSTNCFCNLLRVFRLGFANRIVILLIQLLISLSKVL